MLIARLMLGRLTPRSKGSSDILFRGIRSIAAFRPASVERGPISSASGRAATGSVVLPDGSRGAVQRLVGKSRRQLTARAACPHLVQLLRLVGWAEAALSAP